MICAKFLDAIARIPGNAGEDSDAQKAYTQAILADFEEKIQRLGLSSHQTNGQRNGSENTSDP